MTVVKFSQCDPFGHLYNVRYLDCMFDGREQHVQENYPLLRQEMLSDQRNWVISSTNVQYVSPAARGDALLIESSIFGVTRFGVRLEITMTDLQRARVLAVLWSELCYVDLRCGLPTKHDEAVQGFLESIAIPMPDPTLDDRVRSLRLAASEPPRLSWRPVGVSQPRKV